MNSIAKKMDLLSRSGMVCLLVWLTASGPFAGANAQTTADEHFRAVVLPILTKRCGKCHSKTTQRGELELSSLGGIQRGGESGEPLVGASLSESMLWTMIDDGGMPPEDEPQLTSGEKQTLRKWIVAAADLGASANAEKELTENDVIPILQLRCVTCHGARLKRGGVDLRTVKSMLAGGANGPAVVRGEPDASTIVTRIETSACPPQEMLLKYFVRRPSDTELQTIRRWIGTGMKLDPLPADVATSARDPLVTDADRKHWAFHPPQAPANIQSVDDAVIRRLETAGLQLSPQASRDTLIRRAYIDLIGIPPTLERLRHWRHHASDQWFKELVDDLLASPRYGERWGRYWLDIAGYADSEGGVSADPLREVAWKYRDYVVQAFNEDKPYDQFLIKQLAGDELIDYLRADHISDEIVENLVATGFLRMGIDQTGSRTMNFVPERLGVIDNAITIVGSGILGLTLQCAKCHSHKYDPIPHRDYYRVKSIFQGALDEHDWLTFKNRKLQVATPTQQAEISRVNPQVTKALRAIEAEVKQRERELQLTLLRHHYPQQSTEDRDETISALRIADNNRTLPQRRLVEMLRAVELLPDDDQPPAVVAARRKLGELNLKRIRTRGTMAPPATIRALWDRGEPSPTYILRRGEHDKPGRLVGPGVPSVLTDGKTPFEVEPPFPDGTPKTGRRLAFAQWLTQPNHPLTSRVMVNRIWRHHFGAGLVSSLENFGVQGDRPSHPELLDWLAVEFVDRGWSIKEMHRLMMNSEAYRQSSVVTSNAARLDPQNRLLSRMPIRRLNAEALRDSMLFVSGLLDTTMGGFPDEVIVELDGLADVAPSEDGTQRRSIYLQYRRTAIPSLLAAFDYPPMGPNCIIRNQSTVSPQALMLMNDKQVRAFSRAFAERVSNETTNQQLSTDGDRSEAVTAVYALALSRSPSGQELALGKAALRQFLDSWNGDADKALETYCHTIFNSASFLYID